MAFSATVIRVLVASPSDLAEEREAATSAINDYNAQHAAAEGVVLLPIRWETHARPQAGVRPQAAINSQMVDAADILVGMFWVRFGTNTGVADSGTVEEIEQFVAQKKPAMLYFSTRPVNPMAIDVEQHARLREFQSQTYRRALVGTFDGPAALRPSLLRDLAAQVRFMRPKRARTLQARLDAAAAVTELLVRQRQHGISPEDFATAQSAFIGKRRTRAQTADPVVPGEVGPRGHPVGYNSAGDKVEWVPSEEGDGELRPLTIRRGDKAIITAVAHLSNKLWYKRHQDRVQALGAKAVPEEDRQKAQVIERLYGRDQLPCDDLNWGVAIGQTIALLYVMGGEWSDSLGEWPESIGE